MGKFNQPATIERSLKREPTRTLNYEGAEAFTLSPKMELYERVLTCLLEGKFYDPSGSDTRDAIKELVLKVSEIDPEFVLKLSAYARNEMYLRSIPIFLLVEACKYPSTKSYVKHYTPYIIRRADELTEVIAQYINENGQIGDSIKSGMLCNPLKRGIAKAFHNFNEYQFAKYNRKREVKLKDVLRIVHPRPINPEESALFKRILDDTLKIPDTWETYISTHGSTKENWDHIIPKMPIMATLRNLRNFVKVGADITIPLEKLTNPEIIKRSKQFPFRFFSAYKVLQEMESTNLDVTRLMDAVQDAMDLSVTNLPRLKGVSFLTADNSGSMSSVLSERSTVQYRDVANILQSIAHRFCDQAYTSVFGEKFAIVNVSKRDSILRNMERFFNTNVGHSTNGWLTFAWLIREKISVDRVLMFTDMQLWNDNSWGGYKTVAQLYREYKSTINPNTKFYLFDLTGYGTSKVPENERNAVLISGWSEKVLEFIPMFESKGQKAIEKIDSYKVGLDDSK